MYEVNFKEKILEEKRNNKISCEELAKKYKVAVQSVYAWVREDRKKQAYKETTELTGRPTLIDEDILVYQLKEELLKLKDENEELKKENEVLKQTIEIFFKDKK